MSRSIQLPVDVRLMNFTVAMLMAAFVLIALVGALRWALHQPIFSIAHIVVSGETEHNNAVSLSTSVAHHLKGNFFTMDLEDTRAVFEQVPWVRKAEVKRVFPSRLEVHLYEHKPVARWDDSESTWVDAQGAVFEAGDVDDTMAEFPTLIGPADHAAEVLAMYRQLTPVFKPLGATVAQLELQPRGHWKMTLSSGTAIELGSGSGVDLSARLGQFAQTVAEVAGRYRRTAAEIESVDLRHPNGYALRLRGVKTGAEATR